MRFYPEIRFPTRSLSHIVAPPELGRVSGGVGSLSGPADQLVRPGLVSLRLKHFVHLQHLDEYPKPPAGLRWLQGVTKAVVTSLPLLCQSTTKK